MNVVYTIMLTKPFTYPELIEIYCKESEAQRECDTLNSTNQSLTQRYYIDTYTLN